MFYLIMLLIGLIGSFFSGLMGIGGAIINYPMLLYIPTWFGVAHFTGHQVSSISMFQVLFASLAGVIAFRKQNPNSNVVHKGLVLYMGASILVGSLIGGMGSKYLPSQTINIIYGVLAILAVILMLIPNKGKNVRVQTTEIQYSKGIAIASAFLVGIVSGIVGAGGAFILIPIMLTVLKIPTRVTIASSLAIVFISSIGGAVGKIYAGHIPLLPTMITVIGSLIGAPFGSKVSKRMNVKYLRWGLVLLIALTAVKIWMSIL